MRTSQPPAVRALPAPPTLLGAVRRSLLVAADGTRDTTTSVTWLQGPSLYVDLRVPADPAAPREGFAGRWSVDGDLAHWTRVVDVAPPGLEPHAEDSPPDEGRLRWDGDVLVEDGVHVAYTEHWHLPDPAACPTRPAGGLLLAGGERGERAAVLVRVGQRFGWAAHDDGGAWVALGDVEASGAWRVTSATRADAEGCDLAVARGAGGVLVAGRPWRVGEAEGDDVLAADGVTADVSTDAVLTPDDLLDDRSTHDA